MPLAWESCAADTEQMLFGSYVRPIRMLCNKCHGQVGHKYFKRPEEVGRFGQPFSHWDEVAAQKFEPDIRPQKDAKKVRLCV